jgi:hypothetical protein
MGLPGQCPLYSTLKRRVMIVFAAADWAVANNARYVRWIVSPQAFVNPVILASLVHDD